MSTQEESSRTIDNFGGGTFQFSGANLDELDEIGVSQYSLFGLGVDVSGSTSRFQKPMERAGNIILKASKLNQRADNMMLRSVAFSQNSFEVPTSKPGFQLLHDLCPGDFDPKDADDLPTVFNGEFKPIGSTALIEAGVNLADSLRVYGGLMVDDNDYEVNGGLFLMTDGANNSGKYPASDGSDNHHLKEAFDRIRAEEKIESFAPYLIAVGCTNPTYRAALEKLASDCEFTPVPHHDEAKRKAGETLPFLDVTDVSTSGLARLAQWISESLSETSKALGSGGPSKPIAPSASF